MKFRTGLATLAVAGTILGTATVPAAASAHYPHPGVVLQYWKAEGTISPVGPKGKGWCLTLYVLSPNAPLWWEPCEPIGQNAGQLFTAIQVKIKGLPPAVLAITTFTVPPPNLGYTRLCVGGIPYNREQASVYDCSEHLDIKQAIYIYGGGGKSNRLRNLKGKFLTFWGGFGPANWQPKNARISGHKPTNAIRFNGELTMNGWEPVEGAAPSWT